MQGFRSSLLIVVVLATSACASRPAKPEPGPDPVAAANPDPWESYNRRVYRVNHALDQAVLRPVALAYERVTPDPVQAGVTRFFGNLREPVTVVNRALQLRPAGAAQSLGRFVLNSTVGVAGLFDPATRLGLPRGQEDFGQTLAIWGWHDSRYLVMPLLGPRTVRDTVGMFADQPLSPLGRIDNSGLANGLTALQLADARALMLPVDGLRDAALDEYAMVRDAWMQRRAWQIDQDR